MGVAEVGGAALEAVVDASLGFEVDKELGGLTYNRESGNIHPGVRDRHRSEKHGKCGLNVL